MKDPEDSQDGQRGWQTQTRKPLRTPVRPFADQEIPAAVPKYKVASKIVVPATSKKKKEIVPMSNQELVDYHASLSEDAATNVCDDGEGRVIKIADFEALELKNSLGNPSPFLGEESRDQMAWVNHGIRRKESRNLQ